MATIGRVQPRKSTQDVGPSSWWICTDPLKRGGQKILGPFESRNLALEVRRFVEIVNKPMTYWVDSEA